MKKNPYDLINQTKTDLENYNEEQLSQLEKERMREFMKNQNNNKKRSNMYKNLGVAAAAAVILVSSVGGVSVAAMENPTAYKIASFLGVNKNLDSYETLLNKEVTLDGITLALKGAIIDNDELVVSVITKAEQDLTNIYSAPGGQVFINGEEINKGATMEATLLDSHTVHSLIKFPLAKTFDGDLDVKLELSVPLQNMTKSPHWVFEFNTNGDQLKADTVKTEINKTFTLENGTALNLEAYSQNAVSTKIAFSVDQPLEGQFIDVLAVDENGNKATFRMNGINSDTGYLTLAPADQMAIEQGNTLTLTVFANNQQVGEAFQIAK